MKIAQITDLHIHDGLAYHFQVCAENNVDTIFSDIEEENVDLVICTGDYGSIEGVRYLKRKLETLGKKYLFCLGNHDKAAWLIDAELINNENELETHIDFDGFSIITLDSSKGFLTDDQIDRIVHKQGNQLKLVFTHYPVLPTSKSVFDEKLGIKLSEQQLMNVLNRNSANLAIFAGHYHSFDEIKKSEIQQIICPSALMQLTELNNKISTESFKFGYNIIEVKENKISYRTKLFDGVGVDTPWQ